MLFYGKNSFLKRCVIWCWGVLIQRAIIVVKKFESNELRRLIHPLNHLGFTAWQKKKKFIILKIK